jgi:oligosaccharide repeat unit polymerase
VRGGFTGKNSCLANVEFLMTNPKTNPFETSRGSLRLSWPLPVAAVLILVTAMVPLISWCGLADPNLIPAMFGLSWDSPGVFTAVTVAMLVLFFVPLTWMLVTRRGDIMAMWLMQGALLLGGYFFLPQSSESLNIRNLAPDIIRAGVWVTLLNVAGFSLLLLTLGITYFTAAVSGATIKPPPPAHEIRDQRLAMLLRLGGLFNVAVIVAGMAVAHTIPMLAADPAQARSDFGNNAVTRPFYNAGMAILPFIVGGLMVMFFRNPRRYLGLDGWLVALILFMQLLSGNRYTLAIAAMVTIVLLSLEKKWPRSLLFAAIMGYLILFVGLSGLTSIWRQNRGALASGDSLLVTSFREAYLGNNLIDYRDTAWVFSQWDRQPIMGKTYLSGLADMVPSGVFPMKRQWHLGHTALRIVGWGEEEHSGLRLSTFGESFLNFGYVGVVGMATILGILLGSLLRYVHLLGRADDSPYLFRNLSAAMLMQMLLVWTNSSDAYACWALLVLLIGMKAVTSFVPSPPVALPGGRAA